MSDATLVSPLRAAREHLGYSREKVAAELNVSSKTIERWEAGQTSVKRWRLIQLAKIYGVGVDQLEVAT